MVEFKNPHYDKELEEYINSHPMFCEENTRGGVICKSDFFNYIYSRNASVLDEEFEDIDYAFWIAGSLKCTGYHDKPVEITWERTNEFFDRIEQLWEEFYGTSTGFELRNQNNGVVILNDDEDFVV